MTNYKIRSLIAWRGMLGRLGGIDGGSDQLFGCAQALLLSPRHRGTQWQVESREGVCSSDMEGSLNKV